jgi:putative oxidoreductase
MTNPDQPIRDRQALTILRWALSAIIFIHGAYRALAGGVVPFGGWLEEQGLPFGVVIAALITTVEIIGTPILAWGKLQRPLALWYASQLVVGIIMVHAPDGWFAVGGGRNGAEFSTVLVVGFLLTAWVAPPMRALKA